VDPISVLGPFAGRRCKRTPPCRLGQPNYDRFFAQLEPFEMSPEQLACHYTDHGRLDAAAAFKDAVGEAIEEKHRNELWRRYLPDRFPESKHFDTTTRNIWRAFGLDDETGERIVAETLADISQDDDAHCEDIEFWLANRDLLAELLARVGDEIR